MRIADLHPGARVRVACRSSVGLLRSSALALLCSTGLGVVTAHAQNATWVGGNGGDPNEWVEPNNWTPATVPTGTATFTNTGITTVMNDNGVVSVGAIQFTGTPNAQAYTINVDNPFIINAAGVTNSSTNTQTFNIGDGNALVFQNSSTANNGSGSVVYNNSGTTEEPGSGFIDFENTSNAGNANTTITNNGVVQFNDSSSAGSATITNNTQLDFFNTSTAGSANITNATNATVTFNNTATAAAATLNNSGTIDFSNSSVAGTAAITNGTGGTTGFFNQSTAASATIVNNSGGSTTFGTSGSTDTATAGTANITDNSGGSTTFNAMTTAGAATITNNSGGTLTFNDSSTAGSSVIGNAGTLTFNNSSTAGSATITTNSGGSTLFTASSSGGTAQFITNSGGSFDISGLTSGGTTAGSIAGAGNYFLGGNALTVGSLNTSTTVSGVISDGGASGGTGGSLVKVGTGTLTLTGTNTYSGGTTISAGTLQIGNGGTTGSIVGNVTDNGSLAFDHSNNVTFGNVISGTGALTQLGTGTLILTGTNTYSGGTTISAGTLQIGNGGTTGAITGNVTDNAALVFDLSNTATLGGAITGSGTLTQAGSGTLLLSGNSNYAGATNVSAGVLDVTGSLGNTAVTVANGATLEGTGSIAGPVTLAAGSTLMPGSGGAPGTITLGPLTIGAGSFLSYQLGTPGVPDDTSDLTKVNGNLTINGGTLNVTSASVSAGVYEIIGYSGTLGGSGSLAVGTLPAGDTGVIQTVIPGEVNLVVSGATAITQFWDGAAMTPTGTVQGGSGTWNTTNTNWTSANGTINSTWQNGVAVFAGAAGTVSVAAAISYQGLQFMTTGYTLAASGGGTLAPVGVAPIIVSSGLTETISAPIVGSGGVAANGPGTLVLSGTNAYTGGTALNSGTLVVGNNSALGTGTLAMSAGTTLSFLSTGNFTITNPITMAGDPNFTPPSGTTQTVSGVIANGASAGTLNMNGAGTLVLTAANTYTGPTNVNSGTLDVAGSIASSSLTTVASGAALTGTGTIGNLQVGGTFQPGNGTPGTTTAIAGNLAFQSGAIYLVQVNPSTASIANVTGTASLNGTVFASFAAGNYVTKKYDILHSAGLGGTTFSGVTSNLSGNFDTTLTYSSTDVFLNLTAGLGAGTALNVNEQNVASAIDHFFNSGGTLPAGFVNLFNLTGSNLANALTQLDGEDATGAEHGAFELTNEFLGLMLDPFVYGRGGPASGGAPLGFAPDQQASLPPDIALAYAGVLKAPPKPVFDQRWTVWGASYGGSGTFNGDPAIGSTNVTANTYGFAAGADYHATPDTVLGFALAAAGTNWGLEQGLGTGRSDAFQAGVYGTRYFGPAYLGAAFAFTNNWFTTNRAALGDELTARFQGQSYGERAEGGYRYAVAPAAGVTPYAAIQAQNFHTPTYSETDLTGGGFGLTYNAMTATDTRSELGARFDALTAWGAMPVQLRARVAWAHDWVDNPALSAAFQALPGTSFVVNGAPVPHDSALTTVGAELHLAPQWTLIGKFDGEFANSTQIYAGSGTLRYTW